MEQQQQNAPRREAKGLGFSITPASQKDHDELVDDFALAYPYQPEITYHTPVDPNDLTKGLHVVTQKVDKVQWMKMKIREFLAQVHNAAQQRRQQAEEARRAQQPGADQPPRPQGPNVNVD